MADISYFDIIKDASSRLFHVDRDCFLVYCGSRLDEKRPFLRIGASKNIPKDLLKKVKYLLLTPELFQNFNFEYLCLDLKSQDRLTIVGTEDQVDDYFTLMASLNIPQSKFERLDFFKTS